MSDGKHCPACGKDIGIWPVLSAGLPTWVRCPHCKARLTYGSGVLLLLSVAVLAVSLGTVAFYLASQHLTADLRINKPWKFYSLTAAAFLVLWIPVEIGLTLYIRGRGELKKTG